MIEGVWLLWATLALASVAAILALYTLFAYSSANKQLKETVNNLAAQLAYLESICNDAQARVEETHTALTTLHRSVAPLQDNLSQLEGKVRDQAPNDPQIKLYQRATEMAKEGITVEEIASACDLPLAEAKLLVSLYTKS